MSMRPITMIVRDAEVIIAIIRCVDVVVCERSLDRGVHQAERIGGMHRVPMRLARVRAVGLGPAWTRTPLLNDVFFG